MPLYIQGKRTFNRDSWITHKNLMKEYTFATRMIRGGHPQYIPIIKTLSRKIILNKLSS